MSATFTMYGREFMQKALFTPTEFLPIANLQVALCRSAPAANAAVSQLLEPSTLDGYARVNYSTGAGKWAPTGFAEFYNVDEIVFGAAAADWGWISGFALLDPLAGQCVVVGSLSTPFVATLGAIPKLEAGAISLGLYD